MKQNPFGDGSVEHFLWKKWADAKADAKADWDAEVMRASRAGEEAALLAAFICLLESEIRRRTGKRP